MIHKNPAFTLIEMTVVLCLVTVLVTLGMVQFSFLDSTIARIEIDKLSTVCSFLQQQAIVTQREQVLIFDKNNNEYHCGGIKEKMSSRISFGFLPHSLGPPGCPTHVIEKEITFPGSSIYFYPTGIISSGSVYIVDKKKQNMYALSNAVSKVSFLRLYRYDNGWKVI